MAPEVHQIVLSCAFQGSESNHKQVMVRSPMMRRMTGTISNALGFLRKLSLTDIAINFVVYVRSSHKPQLLLCRIGASGNSAKSNENEKFICRSFYCLSGGSPLSAAALS
jgi:hypothetical protein